MCGPDGKPSEVPYKTVEFLRPKPVEEAVDGDLVVEEFPMTYDGVTYPHSRIAYVKGRPPAPVVLVHHNYAGLKQFDIDQAAFLARVGYVGVAVDCYDEIPTYTYADRNPTAQDTEERRKAHSHGAFDFMQALLLNPKGWRGLLGAYLEAAFKHPAVADGLAGCIGYCLGGQACLEQLRAGHKIQAVVTFHGILHSRPMYKDDCYNPLRRITQAEYRAEVDVPPTTMTPGCRVVCENGSHDEHVPLQDVGGWMVEMDEHKVDWRLNTHARTPHGFALAPGVIASCYVEAADRRSTLSMLSVFAEAWPAFKQYAVETNASGTALGQMVVQQQ